jgi:C-terminal processing protease CtpA/Prc
MNNKRLKPHPGIRTKSMGKVPESIRSLRLTAVLLFVVFGYSAVMARGPAENLTVLEIRAATEAVAETFSSKYILPDEGQRIADVIREGLKKGTYVRLSCGRDLAAHLQKDAKSVNGDPHIRITFAPEEIASMKDPERQKIVREEAARRAHAIHHGFEEIRILPGHIGYLKLNRFMGSPEAFETAESAMCFLAGCPAVIVDLRWNPGGESSMVQFLCSYFFSEEPQLLDVFHFRENNRIEQLWTLPYVPGRRLEHADLYILTSGLTFSAAEGMAYDLQALDRAVIVGETTMGGAHPVAEVIIEDKFLISLPCSYSKNPVTKSNFEGTGVQPDVALDREGALTAAHRLALENLLSRKDIEAEKPALNWALEGIASQSVKMSDKTKNAFAGTYGPNRILFENGALYYQFWPGKLRMLPIAEDYFALENFDAFRVRIIKEGEIVAGIDVVNENGSVQRFEKLEK